MDRFFQGSYYPNRSSGLYGPTPMVELLVPMCCAKCEEKIYEEMMEVRGVQGVLVDRQAQRVVVHGFVDPMRALKRAKKVKRDSQIWSGDSILGGRSFFSSPKYRRSSYRAPSLYRASSYEYQPSLWRTSSYEYRQPSVYRSSYSRYTPGQSYGPRQPYGPVYDDVYGHVSNPYYAEYY